MQTRFKMSSSRAQLHRRAEGSLKWVAVVAVLLLAGLSYYLYSANQATQIEVARLQVDNEELKKSRDELEALKAQVAAKPTDAPENAELVKLRGEVAELRTWRKQQQGIQAENVVLKTTIAQLQQVGKENSALVNQNQQLQGTLAASAQMSACVANLKAIDAVKANWALQLRKAGNDVPLDTDLFGVGRFMPFKPACPAGGAYNLGPIQGHAACSIPGHAY